MISIHIIYVKLNKIIEKNIKFHTNTKQNQYVAQQHNSNASL